MRLARDRRGVVGVDFAVSIGTVLVVVFAILDLGNLVRLWEDRTKPLPGGVVALPATDAAPAPAAPHPGAS